MHAFRKLGTEALPPEDCHYSARTDLVKEKGFEGLAPLAVSIAWDWQFRGITAEGIHRETTSMLESQYLVESRQLMSLATTRAALLAMAKHISPDDSEDDLEATLFPFSSNDGDTDLEKAIAKGIAPAIKHIIRLELDVVGKVERTATNSLPVKGGCMVNDESDQQRDPESYRIDPDGASYVCRFCGVELANLYFHCFGCEKILGKDFNFCGSCYSDKRRRAKKALMVERDAGRQSNSSHVNHIGERPAGATKCTVCEEGSRPETCSLCKKCLGTLPGKRFLLYCGCSSTL